MNKRGARLNYVSIPIDYIRELKYNGERKKARAFSEYFDDMDGSSINSFSFYAKSWDVSKSTSFKWIKEFKDEIALFYAHWQLKNSQHYSNVQKSIERFPNASRTIDPSQSTINTDFKKNSRTITERLSNEVFNTNNNKGKVPFFSPEFEDLYNTCRMFYKSVGRKQEVYDEYLTHKEIIGEKDLRWTYILYINDPTAANKGKHYGLVNFLKNSIYLSYQNPRVEIKLNDKLISGEYDKEKEKLNGDDGKYYTLSKERFTELLRNNQVKIDFNLKSAG